MHKPNLSENEISHLIAQIIYLFNKSTDTKENIKQFNDLIDTAIEDVIRMANKKVIDNIKSLEIDYKDNDDKKIEHTKVIKYKKIHKKKAIDEYYKSPRSTNTDNKNLHKIKKTEEEKLKILEDRQRLLFQASSLQHISLDNILNNNLTINQKVMDEHLENIN